MWAGGHRPALYAGRVPLDLGQIRLELLLLDVLRALHRPFDLRAPMSETATTTRPAVPPSRTAIATSQTLAKDRLRGPRRSSPRSSARTARPLRRAGRAPLGCFGPRRR